MPKRVSAEFTRERGHVVYRLPLDGTTDLLSGCFHIGRAVQPHLIWEVSMVYADGPLGPPDLVKAAGNSSDMISVVQEVLQIEKIRQITGKVRVDLTTQIVDEVVKVDSQTTEMVVSRYEIGRMIEAGEALPQVRLDGPTTIIPVFEEVTVTQTRLVLRAELHVTAKVTAQTDSHTIPLRKQTANVTRINSDGIPLAVDQTPQGD